MALFEITHRKHNSSFYYFNSHISIDKNVGVFISLTFASRTITFRNNAPQSIIRMTPKSSNISQAPDASWYDAMEILIARDGAREMENWDEADRCRDQLLDLGYKVKDTPQGSKLIKFKLKDSNDNTI